MTGAPALPAGWLFQVTVDSVHAPVTLFSSWVRPIASGRIEVKQSRRSALVTVDPPVMLDRSNSSSERSTLLTRIAVAVPKFWAGEVELT